MERLPIIIKESVTDFAAKNNVSRETASRALNGSYLSLTNTVRSLRKKAIKKGSYLVEMSSEEAKDYLHNKLLSEITRQMKTSIAEEIEEGYMFVLPKHTVIISVRFDKYTIQHRNDCGELGIERYETEEIDNVEYTLIGIEDEDGEKIKCNSKTEQELIEIAKLKIVL